MNALADGYRPDLREKYVRPQTDAAYDAHDQQK